MAVRHQCLYGDRLSWYEVLGELLRAVLPVLRDVQLVCLQVGEEAHPRLRVPDVDLLLGDRHRVRLQVE